ncbi:globin-like protein [Paraphaeosphaeria sporulosa]|uniref:nitric oxide dioxygenase n=1 Tax=Paraphaeosphaeria sporulosa TaxID=1460663 RepID=A0A177CWL5_9PLEO|nr:globin-like protein [Paraphaeosphaeria sporulosa]OAG11903.1 globin-like protein [Paraphaeosphaeria sporulosa]
MAAALTPAQTAIVKSTVPVLAQHGETITAKFYHDMISANPSLKNIFNHTHQATGHQARALAGALYAYAANLDDLGKLSPAVELICHKHVSLNVQAEHYGIVGEFLLKTMKAVLGDAATEELLDAWGAAYWQLANIMIDKEAQMYAATSYWQGWQDFKITRKEKESEEITSFYFEPVDANLKLPLFKPGQYVSVNMFIEELDGGVWQARQYSLSDAPGKPYLRISVKREPEIEIGEPKHMAHAGYLSNILHDTKEVGDVVKLSHPFGDFFFEDNDGEKDSPVVLISAGVGLTCLMSILNALVEDGGSRPITWIHGSRHSRVRAFKAHVDELAARERSIRKLYFSSSPVAGEVKGQHYDVEGRVNLDKIEQEHLFTENKKAQYFVCGPTQFMLEVEAKLKSFGVDDNRVHMELFGTGGVPRV